MQIEIYGQTIEIECKDGKFVKPDVLKRLEGFNVALKPAYEPIVLAMAPLDGTFAHNALQHGVAGLWVDGGRVGTNSGDDYGRSTANARGTINAHDGFEGKSFKIAERDGAYAHKAGRFPANLILDEHAGAMLDAQSGVLKSGANPTRRASDKFRGTYSPYEGQRECVAHRGADSGGASRFFYCPKASRSERNKGLEGVPPGAPPASGRSKPAPGRTSALGAPRANHHPTVKPLALMRYLAKLTRTPTGGVVLDPFMGSGTTGVACVNTGRDFVGIELLPVKPDDPDYYNIAQQRIQAAQNEMVQLTLEEAR